MYLKQNRSRSELVDAAVYNNLKTELYHSFSDEDISVLKHHGILGQKWGIRRYQNEDGTLTDAGKKRYGKNGDKAIEEVSNKIYSHIHNDRNIQEMEELRQPVDNHYIRHKIWESGPYIDHLVNTYGEDFTRDQENKDYVKIENKIHKDIADSMANSICANNEYLQKMFMNNDQMLGEKNGREYTKQIHPIVAGIVYTELKDRAKNELYLSDDELKKIAYKNAGEYLY